MSASVEYLGSASLFVKIVGLITSVSEWLGVERIEGDVFRAALSKCPAEEWSASRWPVLVPFGVRCTCVSSTVLGVLTIVGDNVASLSDDNFSVSRETSGVSLRVGEREIDGDLADFLGSKFGLGSIEAARRFSQDDSGSEL